MDSVLATDKASISSFLQEVYKYDAATNQWESIERYMSLNVIEKREIPNAVVTVTSAEVLALNTTIKELVPAQGAGTAIMVDRIVGFVDYNSVAYATNVTMEFRYTDASGAKVTADMATLLNATVDKFVTVAGVVTALVPVANSPIIVGVAAGDPVTGNSPITIFVYYTVVDSTATKVLG